mmetsp:Transcript_80105/g.201542  ORF Transcript_80105/g.201542 Transcript_80105/m.201542 type:complete len:104 (-) Transcript_80105:78-389(-)
MGAARAHSIENSHCRFNAQLLAVELSLLMCCCCPGSCCSSRMSIEHDENLVGPCSKRPCMLLVLLCSGGAEHDAQLMSRLRNSLRAAPRALVEPLEDSGKEGP